MKLGDDKKKIIPVKSETSKHNNHTFPPKSTIGLHVVMNVVIFECVHKQEISNEFRIYISKFLKNQKFPAKILKSRQIKTRFPAKTSKPFVATLNFLN